MTLANSHVGKAVTGAVSLTNSAATTGYYEALDAGLSGASSGFTATGTISALMAGAVDSTHLLVGTTASVAGAFSGTATLGLISDGTTIDGLGTTELASQTVKIVGAAYAYAQGGLANSGSVTLANSHVGQAVSAALSLANGAAKGSYSEALDAKLSGASAGFTASGTLTGLAAGSTDTTHLLVGTTATAAGAYSGTATLGLISDGTSIDGLGTTTLTSQTVKITGAAYAYAQGTVGNAGTVALANSHVGQAVSASLSLGNAAATGSYSEALDASLSGASTGFSAIGTLTGLAAGSTDTTHLVVGTTASAAGAYSGTATLGLLSDGTGIDGLGTTTLASQTVTITGAAYAYAQGTVANNGTVVLANSHVGQAVASEVTITNAATANGFSEALDGSLGGASAGFSASGSFSGITAGNNTSTPLVGYTASAAGAYSGTASLSLTSDGAGIDGLGTTTLANQTVTVSGAAYAYATPKLASTSINLGVVHVGSTASQALNLTNSAAANVYSEALDACWSTPSTGVTATGTLTGLGAGKANTSALLIGLSTAASGTFSGTAKLNLTSDGTGIDGLGTTSLTASTISVSGTLDNYAVAALQDGTGPTITGAGSNFVVNLGSIAQGSSPLSLSFGAKNAAAGLADLLQGTIASAGGTGFTNTGFGTFSGLGAGLSETAQSVTLATINAGTFTETVTLTASGTNTSRYIGALPTETLTITGTIAPVYSLVVGPNSVVGANGGDIFKGASGSINSHDSLTGGTGTNSLQLLGGGVFDIGAPKVFANIQNIAAQEGQAPATSGAADGRQTLFLRDGTTEAVVVLAGTAASGNTSPEAITIYDGNDTDSFALASGADALYLGAGTDTVTLGGAANSVFAGGGTASISTTAANATAAVVGTSASVTSLEITTGGTVALNAADTYLTVKLDSATTLTLGAGGFLTANGGNGGDTLIAGAANQTLLGGMGDKLTGFSGGGDTFAGLSAALNGDAITNWASADVLDLTDMNSSTLKALTYTSGTGQLTVNDGTHNAVITFAGSLALSNFTILGTDGHGGSLIGFH